MQKQKIEITLSYPTEIKPGEDIFCEKGLTVSPFSGQLFLNFRSSDLTLLSPLDSEENTLIMHGASEEQEINVQYHASSEAKTGKRQFGIFSYVKIYQKHRLVFYCLLVSIFILPSLLLAFKSSLLSATVNLYETIAIQIPFYFLLALIFTSQRLIGIFKVIVKANVTSAGSQAFSGGTTINIVEEEELFDHETLTFTVELPKRHFLGYFF